MLISAIFHLSEIEELGVKETSNAEFDVHALSTSATEVLCPVGSRWFHVDLLCDVNGATPLVDGRSASSGVGPWHRRQDSASPRSVCIGKSEGTVSLDYRLSVRWHTFSLSNPHGRFTLWVGEWVSG